MEGAVIRCLPGSVRGSPAEEIHRRLDVLARKELEKKEAQKKEAAQKKTAKELEKKSKIDV